MLRDVNHSAVLRRVRDLGDRHALSNVLNGLGELSLRTSAAPQAQEQYSEALALAPGSIVALDRMAGEPVDLLVNGKRIARGEVVAIDEEFGLRVTEVLRPRSGR